MEKEQYIPLTIDRAATKANVVAGAKELQRYARRRKICVSTLNRILLDGKSAYPFQEQRASKFQACLRKLKTDGYLVEQKLDAAA